MPAYTMEELAMPSYTVHDLNLLHSTMPPYTVKDPRHASLHARDGGSQGEGEDLHYPGNAPLHPSYLSMLCRTSPCPSTLCRALPCLYAVQNLAMHLYTMQDLAMPLFTAQGLTKSKRNKGEDYGEGGSNPKAAT